VSKRGYYLGGHTVLRPTSSWFTGRPKPKKKRKFHPRVKLKRKPRKKRETAASAAPAAPAMLLQIERVDPEMREARLWASRVTDVKRALARDDLTYLQQEALKERMLRDRQELDGFRARRWAAKIKDIKRALERNDLTQAQREALIEVAVARKRAAAS
jgi:hypothetical protein